MPHPDDTMGRDVSVSAIRGDIGKEAAHRQMDPSFGASAYALGLCKVVEINYEEFMVTLRSLSGEAQEFQHVPVPMTFPGAGTRHFFGAMPRQGDVCVVGWIPQSSTGAGQNAVGSKLPIIVAWTVPGVWTGHDWVPTQDFEDSEWDYSPKNAALIEGAYQRQRHKLPHMRPGNIVASSAQGSDILLDEGVTIANRRGNEIRLRDQDQALVLRTLQQFHAMAGARVYAGMVQRDAAMLQTQMVSDGSSWDSPTQVDENGDPIPVDDLPDSLYAAGTLTPTELLTRRPTGEGLTSPGIALGANLDPYVLLRRGLYMDGQGFMADGYEPEAVYGGKPLYRVSYSPNFANSVADEADLPTLTEYRVEVAHTSDGRLPVTDETDGFDADRLPDTPDGSKATDMSPNRPFMEWVLGSVVGNDPFSEAGRTQYGLPLGLDVFTFKNLESNVVEANPRLSPRLDTRTQAASLLRVRPPMEGWGSGSMTSFTKDGRLRAYLGGPEGEDSLQLATAGNARIALGGQLFLQFHGPFRINHASKGDKNNHGLDFRSETAGVVIYGGGQIEDDTVPQAISPSGEGGSPADKPSVLIRGNSTTQIEGGTSVNVQAGQRAKVAASQVTIDGTNNVQVSAGDRVAVSGKQYELSVTGKAIENFSGPKDNLPSTYPLRETTFSTIAPTTQTVDKATYQTGSREEVFNIGNHTTSMLVGDMTYETEGGTWKARSLQNEATLSPDGFQVSVAAGVANIEAKAGAASLKGSASVTVSSNGSALVSGTMVTLGANGTAGGIVSGGDIDPLNGQPLSSPINGNMGSAGHVLGPMVT